MIPSPRVTRLLRTAWWRHRGEGLAEGVYVAFFAGAEHFFAGAGALYMVLNIHCERMRAAEHAPRGPFCLLESRHGLADIVERGVVGFVSRTIATS